MKYTLNDIFIVQASLSEINSRSECNPYHSDDMLPLFTAPMASVVDLSNYELFQNNKINSIIPRTVDLFDRKILCAEVWCAFSLDEFISFANINPLIISEKTTLHVLIDIANGNMKKLHDAIRSAKEAFGSSMQIMAGNIANPEAYRRLSESGADYVRVGIGTGSVCITSSNTAVHYPMASLIKECYEVSLELKTPAYIIADGGIKGFGDIEKALALGADYVMCGSVFNKMLESAGETLQISPLGEVLVIDQYNDLSLNDFNNGIPLYKKHYGMSTKKAQREIGSETLKTSEGIEKLQRVECTMSKWTENFTDYLRSTMSYTNSRELYDFIGAVKTIVVSNNSYDSVNK